MFSVLPRVVKKSCRRSHNFDITQPHPVICGCLVAKAPKTYRGLYAAVLGHDKMADNFSSGL